MTRELPERRSGDTAANTLAEFAQFINPECAALLPGCGPRNFSACARLR